MRKHMYTSIHISMYIHTYIHVYKHWCRERAAVRVLTRRNSPHPLTLPIGVVAPVGLVSDDFC